MKPFEVLEHTADLKIRVFGEDRRELFKNAMKGMMEAMGPVGVKGETKERLIEVESPDWESLLVDFLNEALYLFEVERETYREVEFEVFEKKKLKAKLKGKKIKGFEEDIKAVTYHGLEIKKNDHWQVDILFDV